MAYKNIYEVIQSRSIVLLDIEGTTTSINFVKDVLFVKARELVKDYLLANYDDIEVKGIIDDFRNQVNVDIEEGRKGVVQIPHADQGGKENVVETLTKNILSMMDEDRKVKPLKTLQGKIWKEEYENGNIQGHVYEDVIYALESWKKGGKEICIYSSGSIEAQKLLFKHSAHGDLLHYFSKHFDTSLGRKVDPGSYVAIAESLSASTSEIIFITDVEAEANAASSVGVETIVSVRPGTKPLSSDAQKRFPTINTFSDLT